MSEQPLLVRQLKLGTMDNFVYVIGDPVSREAAVVDAAWDVEAILEEANRHGLRVTAALITHRHPDHTSGVRELVKRTGAQVYVGAEEMPHLKAWRLDAAGPSEEARLGNRAVRVLRTPGHTAGSQCYLVDGNLFTGDTLFVGACGRVAFGECSAAQMLRSLREVLLPLPEDVVVWPGHDYDDTPFARLGDVKRRNRALQVEDVAEFERYVTGPRWPDEE